MRATRQWSARAFSGIGNAFWGSVQRAAHGAREVRGDRGFQAAAPAFGRGVFKDAGSVWGYPDLLLADFWDCGHLARFVCFPSVSSLFRFGLWRRRCRASVAHSAAYGVGAFALVRSCARPPPRIFSWSAATCRSFARTPLSLAAGLFGYDPRCDVERVDPRSCGRAGAHGSPFARARSESLSRTGHRSRPQSGTETIGAKSCLGSRVGSAALRE